MNGAERFYIFLGKLTNRETHRMGPHREGMFQAICCTNETIGRVDISRNMRIVLHAGIQRCCCAVNDGLSHEDTGELHDTLRTPLIRARRNPLLSSPKPSCGETAYV